MNRHERYELNQRLARIEKRLSETCPNPSGPSSAPPLDLFKPDMQQKFLRDGRVIDGKVY